jgi:hypothetical protein
MTWGFGHEVTKAKAKEFSVQRCTIDANFIAYMYASIVKLA